MAALYLLFRKGNAFAPDVTPPLRLHRWTAAFFAVLTFSHVWWMLFYAYSGDLHSVSHVIVVMFDIILLFITFAGMLLAMLQDRHRSMWPALVTMTPFVALCGAFMLYPSQLIEQIASVYLLLLSLLFTVYMVFAIRQYGRWLNDNYADLENKKVWLCQVVALVCMLLFVLYVLATDIVFIWLIHIIELVLVGLLLWRVETLPTLETRPQPLSEMEGSGDSQDCNSTDDQSAPLSQREEQGGSPVTINLEQIQRLLEEHCVTTRLYLQHDLTLQQLAKKIGTNRSYLSQYFSRQGITYNTYINNLRINHFISRYQEYAITHEPFTVQQLANESGYRSYSTFSLAFKQRTGQSVSAWMHAMTG